MGVYHRNTLCVFWVNVRAVSVEGFDFVDSVFLYCWRRCPNAVLVDGGIYFLMRSADKPVHVEKNPASIAGIHVDTTGLKHIL